MITNTIPVNYALLIGSVICLVISTTSCTSAKKINYFHDISDSADVMLPPMPKEERVVQVGDMLDINFSAREEEAVKPFNKPEGTAVGTDATASGYTVNSDSTIQLPVIGRFPVTGMTLGRLKDTLTQLVKAYLTDPLVTVKFNSFRVTLVGEVRSPGTYSLSNERTTLFEALAAGGDMPTTARKYNVQLYRDYNGQRSISQINMNKSSILNDPRHFQMRPNDVIYVRTRPGSVFREDFAFISSIATLVVTLVTLGLTITK